MKKRLFPQPESANALDFTGHLGLKLQVGWLPGWVDNGGTTQTGCTQPPHPDCQGSGSPSNAAQGRAERAQGGTEPDQRGRKSVIRANEKLQSRLTWLHKNAQRPLPGAGFAVCQGFSVGCVQGRRWLRYFSPSSWWRTVRPCVGGRGRPWGRVSGEDSRRELRHRRLAEGLPAVRARRPGRPRPRHVRVGHGGKSGPSKPSGKCAALNSWGSEMQRKQLAQKKYPRSYRENR